MKDSRLSPRQQKVSGWVSELLFQKQEEGSLTRPSEASLLWCLCCSSSLKMVLWMHLQTHKSSEKERKDDEEKWTCRDIWPKMCCKTRRMEMMIVRLLEGLSKNCSSRLREINFCFFRQKLNSCYSTRVSLFPNFFTSLWVSREQTVCVTNSFLCLKSDGR